MKSEIIFREQVADVDGPRTRIRMRFNRSRESCGAGFLFSMLHLFLPFSLGVDALI
jgi:hypothetical protein